MQLAASLQQSHLIKGGTRQPTGLLSKQLAPALACRAGLLVQGSDSPASALSGEAFSPVSDVVNGLGPQQDSFRQPNLYLYLKIFPLFTHLFMYCLLYARCWARCWERSSGQLSPLTKPLPNPIKDSALPSTPLPVWRAPHSSCPAAPPAWLSSSIP